MGAQRITLEAVESTSLAAIGYDLVKQILAVQFVAGEIYHFAGVPHAIAVELYSAASKGGYFARAIRGRYWGQRMTGPCPTCGDSGWIGERCVDCGCDVYHEVPRPMRTGALNARGCGCDPGCGWTCLECRASARRVS